MNTGEKGCDTARGSDMGRRSHGFTVPSGFNESELQLSRDTLALGGQQLCQSLKRPPKKQETKCTYRFGSGCKDTLF